MSKIILTDATFYGGTERLALPGLREAMPWRTKRVLRIGRLEVLVRWRKRCGDGLIVVVVVSRVPWSRWGSARSVVPLERQGRDA